MIWILAFPVVGPAGLLLQKPAGIRNQVSPMKEISCWIAHNLFPAVFCGNFRRTIGPTNCIDCHVLVNHSVQTSYLCRVHVVPSIIPDHQFSIQSSVMVLSVCGTYFWWGCCVLTFHRRSNTLIRYCRPFLYWNSFWNVLLVANLILCPGQLIFRVVFSLKLIIVSAYKDSEVPQ